MRTPGNNDRNSGSGFAFRRDRLLQSGLITLAVLAAAIVLSQPGVIVAFVAAALVSWGIRRLQRRRVQSVSFDEHSTAGRLRLVLPNVIVFLIGVIVALSLANAAVAFGWAAGFGAEGSLLGPPWAESKL